jgi:hypothetical protein
MAKAKSVAKKKKDAWKCPKKCAMKDGKPCSHLEALLPRPERGSHKQVKLYYTDKIERVANEQAQYLRTPTQNEINGIIRTLQKYGLPEHQIAILLDKFVDNKTLAEITRDRGFTSAGVTYYLYKLALDTLRARGFKLPSK